MINLDGQKSEQADKHIKSGSEAAHVEKKDLSSNADEKVKRGHEKGHSAHPYVGVVGIDFSMYCSRLICLDDKKTKVVSSCVN